MPDYIGALDQGTSSTRFIVFDRTGLPVVRRQQEHRQHLPGPGLVEHDAAELWRNTCQVATEALEAAGLTGKDLVALGVTNQRETVVAWNRYTGKPYGNALVWQDTRTAARMEHLNSTPVGAAIRQKTGLVPSAYFSASKYAWVLQHDKDLARSVAEGAAMLGTVDSWLMWNLTGGADGGIHVTDVTNASRSMLMNIETLEWDPELLEVFDIPSALLPRIVPSAHADKLGHTSAGGPFGAEVPITAMLGDQQAALIGQVCFDPGDVKTTYGTGNFILVNTGKDLVRSEDGLLSTVAYQLGDDEPVYALEGAVAYTGSTLQWLRDEIGVLTNTADSEQLARQVSDNGGVYMVPAFSGLFSPHWRPDARGVIVGLTRHTTAAHLVRAALESICFQTRDVLESMELALGRRIGNMKVDGGVTANDLCMQLQADVLGAPLTRPDLQETTALGAAYAAGLASGFWESADHLRRIWAASASWLPSWTEQDRNHARHQWRKAVHRSLGWIESEAGAQAPPVRSTAANLEDPDNV